MRPLELLETRLLNGFQRDFPLVARPYEAIAQALDAGVGQVLDVLQRRQDDGTISRVGAILRPNTVGVSTLAAMAVPPRRLARVAACVSARPEVNHNYEREHHYNLWFVATARDAEHLAGTLAAIGRDSGIVPLSLPLLTDYAIDLGFDFVTGGRAASPAVRPVERPRLTAADLRIVGALERGLPLVAEPYRALARAAGVPVEMFMARLSAWLEEGIVKRLGIIVRHRPLGYVANAMCVFDVPDEAVDAVGAALAAEPGVTLCYRRVRGPRASGWHYNLFCMIHGRAHGEVLERYAQMVEAHGLDRHPRAVLFSRRAFKQRGARYVAVPAVEGVAA